LSQFAFPFYCVCYTEYPNILFLNPLPFSTPYHDYSAEITAIRNNEDGHQNNELMGALDFEVRRFSLQSENVHDQCQMMDRFSAQNPTCDDDSHYVGEYNSSLTYAQRSENIVVLGLSWAPTSGAPEIEHYWVKVALTAPRVHSILQNLYTFTFMKKISVSHYDQASHTNIPVTYSLFLRRPRDPNTFQDDIMNHFSLKKFVFIRHNDEANQMYASSWAFHRRLLQGIMRNNVEELNRLWENC
jgi:hypothetical protein